MARKAFEPDQIINKLREAEVFIRQGATVAEASRKLGITEQTRYRWRREYGAIRMEQPKRLKKLEKENAHCVISASRRFVRNPLEGSLRVGRLGRRRSDGCWPPVSGP